MGLANDPQVNEQHELGSGVTRDQVWLNTSSG
jgi:hypothetical protein